MKSVHFRDINLIAVLGVLIDIDDTLYSYDTAHKAALAACYEKFRSAFGASLSWGEFCVLYRKKRGGVMERLAPGGACRSRLFAFQDMLESLSARAAYTKALEFDDLYWGVFLDNIEVDEAAAEFLERCKERGLKVCAVSDMQAAVQIKKLLKLGVDKHIEFMVTSEEVGVEKPDPKIFKAALLKMGFAAKDVIMVGDSEEKDIDGAKALGIQAFKCSINQGVSRGAP